MGTTVQHTHTYIAHTHSYRQLWNILSQSRETAKHSTQAVCHITGLPSTHHTQRSAPQWRALSFHTTLTASNSPHHPALYTNTHAHIHTHKHTYIHIYTHIHKHTNTHTNKYVIISHDTLSVVIPHLIPPHHSSLYSVHLRIRASLWILMHCVLYFFRLFLCSVLWAIWRDIKDCHETFWAIIDESDPGGNIFQASSSLQII